MKKTLLTILFTLVLSGGAYPEEVRIICFKDGLTDRYSLVQIDEEKNKFYWDDFLYNIVDIKLNLASEKGAIAGVRDGVFIIINRFTNKASVQKDDTFDTYNCKKEEKLF